MKWTEEEVRLLHAGLREIPGRSKKAIQHKVSSLKSKSERDWFQFPMIRQKFKHFVSNKWAGRLPEDVVELWNKENARYQTDKNKVLVILREMNIDISDSEFDRIRQLREKENNIIQSKSDGQNLLEKIRIERINMMRERVEENKDIWTGKRFKTTPYATFFN